LVERALYVARFDFIFAHDRVIGRRGQAAPGVRIEAAGRLEPVCLLEGRERLLIVAAGLAIDLAGGKTRALERYFLFYDCRGARSTRAALARRRGELRVIDGLRIECRCRCRGMRGGALWGVRGAVLRGVRRV